MSLRFLPCLALILLLMLPVQAGQPLSAPRTSQPAAPAIHSAEPPEATSDPTSYDEQLGVTFTQNFSAIAYNVTAVEQTDPTSQTGPAYLLNGLSSAGYWYQVGLAWNWNPGSTPGTGFDMVYEVFDSAGESVLPLFGGAGLASVSVNPGDTVLLNLYFSSAHEVVMLVRDYNTGSSESVTYSAEGATTFVGQSASTSNSNGFFTGLMTEWWHPNAYYQNEATVTYSDPHFALKSGWMWMEEFSCDEPGCTNAALLFIAGTHSPTQYTDPAQLLEFSSHNATEFSDAYDFITGPAYTELMVSYSVSGGGAGYSPPTFSYVNGGVGQSLVLSRTPQTVEADAGSVWNVSLSLPGSSGDERWGLANESQTGLAGSTQTLDFAYEHQFLLVVTGGSPVQNQSGWYGVGASVEAQFYYEWGEANGSRLSAIGYSLGGSTVSLDRRGNGTFEVQLTMGAPQSLKILSTTQFQLTISGYPQAAPTPQSPTGDWWYDVGTDVQVSVPRYVSIATGQSRDHLSSYTLDGATAVIVGSERGTFTTPAIVMSAPRSIDFNYQTEYMITFTFTNIAGNAIVVPGAFVITPAGSYLANGTSAYWVDAGTTIHVKDIVWQGVDVTPSEPLNYTVTSPANENIRLDIYYLTFHVSDVFGLPVSGAAVQATLSNGSTVAVESETNGTAPVGLVPSGQFIATVSYLGLPTVVTGDPSQGQNYAVTVLLSAPLLVLVVLAVFLILVLSVFRRRRSPPSSQESPQSEPGGGAGIAALGRTGALAHGPSSTGQNSMALL